MKNLAHKYTSGLISTNNGATVRQIDYLNDWGFVPPSDYIEFMEAFTEGEGPIGEHSWLTLWRMDELAQINQVNITMEDLPDYFLFGKDAADTGYAFNKLYNTYHSFGLMSDFRTDDIVYLSSDFSGFIEKLYDA